MLAAIDTCLRASAELPARAGVAGCGPRWRAAAAQLPGDRRDACVKPFCAIEDIHVPLAALAAVARGLHGARQRGWRRDAARFAVAAAARAQRAARARQRLQA